jgi:hypothetical protein
MNNILLEKATSLIFYKKNFHWFVLSICSGLAIGFWYGKKNQHYKTAAKVEICRESEPFTPIKNFSINLGNILQRKMYSEIYGKTFLSFLKERISTEGISKINRQLYNSAAEVISDDMIEFAEKNTGIDIFSIYLSDYYASFLGNSEEEQQKDPSDYFYRIEKQKETKLKFSFTIKGLVGFSSEVTEASIAAYMALSQKWGEEVEKKRKTGKSRLLKENLEYYAVKTNAYKESGDFLAKRSLRHFESFSKIEKSLLKHGPLEKEMGFPFEIKNSSFGEKDLSNFMMIFSLFTASLTGRNATLFEKKAISSHEYNEVLIEISKIWHEINQDRVDFFADSSIYEAATAEFNSRLQEEASLLRQQLEPLHIICPSFGILYEQRDFCVDPYKKWLGGIAGGIFGFLMVMLISFFYSFVRQRNVKGLS